MNEFRPRGGGYRDLVTFVTDRPGHDLRYAIDSSRIEGELGWRPAEQFETGLRKTVQWYLENPRLVAGDPVRQISRRAAWRRQGAKYVCGLICNRRNGVIVRRFGNRGLETGDAEEIRRRARLLLARPITPRRGRRPGCTISSCRTTTRSRATSARCAACISRRRLLPRTS